MLYASLVSHIDKYVITTNAKQKDAEKKLHDEGKDNLQFCGENIQTNKQKNQLFLLYYCKIMNISVTFKIFLKGGKSKRNKNQYTKEI